MRPNIFISYSHWDGELVGPVVALLRASEALVFRDSDRLHPGRKWRDQLEAAIQDSRIVVVFWCHHARSSEEVRKEYTAAIAQDKDVLPLLIDDTPLPPELAEYQYIDFRAAFPGGHTLQPPLPLSKPAWRLSWIAVIATLVAIGSVWFKAPPPGNSPAGVPLGGVFLWPFAAVIALVAALVVRGWLRRHEKEYDVAPSSSEPSNQQVRLATAIETELLRRTAAKSGA